MRIKLLISWISANNLNAWFYLFCEPTFLFFIDEVLECVAGWKEGSSSYLIGRTRPLKRYDLTNSLHTNTRIGLLPSPLDKSHQSGSQDSKYQCFRYEMHVEEGQFVTKMSQSKKGSCEGLWSAVEGDRTYTLKKGTMI